MKIVLSVHLLLIGFVRVLVHTGRYLDVLLIFTEVIAYPVLIRSYLGSFFTIYIVPVSGLYNSCGFCQSFLMLTFKHLSLTNVYFKSEDVN